MAPLPLGSTSGDWKTTRVECVRFVHVYLSARHAGKAGIVLVMSILFISLFVRLKPDKLRSSNWCNLLGICVTVPHK